MVTSTSASRLLLVAALACVACPPLAGAQAAAKPAANASATAPSSGANDPADVITSTGERDHRGRPVDFVKRPSKSPRAQREMQILEYADMGLEVWREMQPSPWPGEFSGDPASAQNPRSLTLRSPEKVYPPLQLIITSLRQVDGAQADEAEFARGLISALAAKYGAGAPAQVRAATYGVLKGFEAEFGSGKGAEAADTRVFLGRAPGRWPVLLQVQALKGQLPHASEVIRRNWTNLRYLRDG